MPFPPPVRTLSGPRRRTLLASAAGAALMAGCSSGAGGSGKEKPGAGPSASAQERARARAASDSAGLLERYDAVLAVHPALTARLAPLRAEVARHVTAFGGTERGTTTSPSASASASASVSASASASASPGVPSAPAVAVPANAKDALADLAGAERALCDLRVAALVDLPGEPARLLASVAASGAAHAYLLNEGAR
ncbi:hypothetical protein P1P75_36810 [Streptomyces sp. ID05-39B]|uniref:hypothetical protein n=1 Tax=Streptomyces sp. ID05-39B TaxID=3028664 RepID=UPI0029BD87FA|nr:hypothetical protein [Streptomyces sp. ID05-39B]MDX3531810.1 hypothetical protein [Streptomyces sp. ID05-39B]